MKKSANEIIIMLIIISFGILSATDSEGAWTSKAPMPTERLELMVCTWNGKIYAVGGFLDGYIPTDINEVYDPSTDSWAAVASTPTNRGGGGAVVVGDKIYVIGGGSDQNPVDTNEEYDPVTDTWTTKAPMPTARNGPAVVVLNDKIYVIGGQDGSNYLTTNEMYDPATDTWTTKAPIPTGRVRSRGAAVNSKIYVIGGWRPGPGTVDTNDEYDPDTNTWTTRASMPAPRMIFGIGVVNNKIYAVGGSQNGPGFDTNEEYNPATDSWTTREPMPTARGGLGVGIVDGKLYAIGGSLNHPDALNTVEQYTSIIIGVTDKGDINSDNKIDLADAILSLQILAGISPLGTVDIQADINDDSKIGTEEAIYILQIVAGIRLTRPPEAPTGLQVTVTSSSSVRLTWSDNSDIEDGFKIERSLSISDGFTQIATVSANLTTYDDTGLSSGTTYYYRVRAHNSVGNSAYSNTASATPSVPFFTLTVSKSGTGSGSITGSGISCGNDCTEEFTSGTTVTLNATADSNSAFEGWSGCDSTSGNNCTVTMNQNRTVTATFSRTCVNVAGAWNTTEVVDATNCGEGIYTEYETLIVTQDGCNFTAIDSSGTYSGTVQGNQISWTGSYYDYGWVTYTVTLTISGNSLSGSSSWTWTDGYYSCSGTSQITGTRN